MRKRTTERREVRVYTGGRSDQYHKAGGMKPQETWSLTVLFISIATPGILLLVEAGYRFEILLVGYQNPFHRLTNGDYCEGPTQRNNPCDNAFIICIRHMGSPANVCDIDRLQTTLIERDSDNLMFREGQSIGGVQNPIAVSGVTWPGKIEIQVYVYDTDGRGNSISMNSDYVTEFIIHPDVNASTNGAYTEKFNEIDDPSSGQRRSLQLAFRLTCLPPHFGPDCSLLCNTSACYLTATTLQPGKTSFSSPDVLTPTITTMPVRPDKTRGSSSTLRPVITVARRPSEDQAPSPVSIGLICTGAILVITAIGIVVTLLVILKMKQMKKMYSQDLVASKEKFEDSQDQGNEGKFEEHLYDTVKTTSTFRTISTTSPPPVYAAVNAMYHIAQEDPDGMAMEKNISYARVDVERNVAYGVVVGQRSQHRPMMPLPDQ